MTAPPPPASTLDDRLAAIPAGRRDPGLERLRESMASEQNRPEEVTA